MKRMGVVVLLGCQAAATPKVEITAPATATVSAPQTPPPSVATAFAFVGKLAPGVTAQAFRLGHSVAVVQSSEHGWTVTAIGADRHRVDLTTKIDAKKRTADLPVLFVGGSAADDAWISFRSDDVPLLDEGTWHVTSGDVTRSSKRYLAIGALHADQWVALPTRKPPAYLYDDDPSKFEWLHGTGDLPMVPANVRLFDVAFLGAGRVCGVGLVHSKASETQAVLWTGGPNGASRTWPVGPIQDASMNVVRGSEGDCVIVTASAPPPFTHSATSFARIQGDALASVKVDECHATLATATPRGIWLYDDDKRAIYRAELAANVAMTVVAFPAGLGECTKIVEVTSLVALDDNDVWATARCDGDGLGERLLHTEPVGTVDSWPAPP